MPSFFDLQRYAKTGIASADMTAYDKMRALAAFGGGTVQTMTGIPPLSFPSDGTPLISWSMLGNGQQTGTPSPDNIIMPTFCGVRTENLFDKDNVLENYYLNNGVPTEYHIGDYVLSDYIPITSNTATISARVTATSPTGSHWAVYDENKIFIRGGLAFDAQRADNKAKVADTSGAAYIRVDYARESFTDLMLNLGSTALQYEHYGYKIPITCAGQTVPIYLGQTQTVRRVKKVVFDGTEGWTENASGENTFRAILALPQANINSADGYCSHLPFVATGISQDIPLAGCYNSAAFLRFDRNIVNNITEFKSYLAEQYAAGTPVTVWYVLAEPTTGIVNEPLCKIGTYADELHSTDAAVTIPTVKGSNTLTVDTELQPSEMTITYRG